LGKNVIANHELTAFLEDAEEQGVVDVSMLDSVAAELELDDDEVAELRGEIEARGIDIAPEERGTEEESREHRPDVTVGTTDSLTLFMNEIGKHTLLTAAD